MKVGLGVMPIPPLSMAEQFVTEAEERGLDGVFVPDRIMSWFPRSIWSELGNIADLLPDPHVFLDPFTSIAAWSQRTSRIEFFTSVTDALRTSPAQLAVNALTLGHVTGGRFHLGIGCGEAANCVPYGVPFDRPVARLDEALTIIRRLWDEDTVDHDGEFWQLRSAACGIEPYFGEKPMIWVGAHRNRMLEITGRHADGWLPFMPFTVDEYASRLETVRLAAERAGRDPMAVVAGLNTPVCIADDHEQAHAMIASFAARVFLLVMPTEFWEAVGIRHPLGIDHGVTELIPEALSEAELRAALDNVPDPMIAHDLIIHGTPEEVAVQLRDFEEAGLQYFAPLDTSPLTDLPLAFGAVERIARVRDLLTATEPSTDTAADTDPATA